MLCASLVCVYIWREPWQQLHELNASEGPIQRIEFSPDGKLLLTTNGYDKSLAVWDVNTGQLKWSINARSICVPIEGKDACFALSTFSLRGDKLLVVWKPAHLSYKREVLTLDSETGNEIAARSNDPLDDTSSSLAPDWGCVAAPHGVGNYGSPPYSVYIFELNQDKKCRGKLEGAPYAFSPDGKCIAVISHDENTAQVFDTLLLCPLAKYTFNNMRLYMLQFSPDGKKLLGCGRDGRLHAWEIANGHYLGATMEETYQQCNSIQGISPSGRFVVGYTETTGKVFVWDIDTQQTKDALISPAIDSGSVHFSFDSTRLFYTTKGCTEIVDLFSGKVLHELPANDATVSPKDEILAVTLRANPGRLQLFSRRFPEWWWGHIFRPEVWLAVLFGVTWLYCVVRKRMVFAKSA